MLRETDYIKMAEDYSTSIGMATYITFESKNDMVKKLRGDEATINEIIAISIEKGIYQQLILKVIELQNKRRANIKDSTIYKKAIKQICD